MGEEIWKDIKRYEGRYQISNHGRAKSLSRQAGTAYLKERLLSQKRLTKDGYPRVALRNGVKAKEFNVHRLVATHFIDNPDGKETVNHKDGDKTNNRVDNLEWNDRSEQMDHAYKLRLKTSVSGSDNSQSKLTDDQVREIRRTFVKGDRQFGASALSRKYGVTHRVIRLVVNGESYKNIQ